MNESDTRNIGGDGTDEKNPPSISRRALLMGLFALPIAAVTLHPEPAQAQFGFPLHLLFRGGGGYRRGSRQRHSGGGRRSRGHGGGRAAHRGHSRQGSEGHSSGGGGGAKGPSGGSFH